MTELMIKIKELGDKEHELHQIRRKVLKGEVGGNGVPYLIQQVEQEINKLKSQIQYLTGKK